jgi:phenylacetate-CoA ligase
VKAQWTTCQYWSKHAPELTLQALKRLQLAKQLQHDVKTFVGTTIAVELKPEGGVERSLGKAKRVVDLRKN